MKYTGCILSDLHFGSTNSDNFYNELKLSFLDYIKYKVKKVDFIVICGDYFDHLLYLNEEPANKACLFMDELVTYAKQNNIKIRIIYGTESHECNQYSIFFGKLMDSDLDFKVIKTVSEENLFPDMKVLYLPEEYIYNKSEYYKNYLQGSQKYNYIFGHGVIQELMPSAVHVEKSSKNSNRAKVPVFNSNELISSCSGEVYFGHYHVNTEIQNKVFYVGSFSRWIFGEEKKKGFYITEFSPTNYSYKHHFIENTLAPEYLSINYGYDSKIFKNKDELFSELKKIESLSDINPNDHVRLVMNIPEEYDDPSSLVSTLNERFKDSKNVKIKLTNGFIKKNQKVNEEYLKETMQKYSFIFDKSMPIEEQGRLFILKKFEKDIPSDIIKFHLETKDILNK